MVRRKKNKKVLTLVEGEGRRKTGVIMGVDVHKSVLAYCIGSEASILKEGTVENTKQAIQGLIGTCKRLQVGSVAMESTAQYHFKLLYGMLGAKIPVLVANARQTKDTQGKKTDKLDARRIFLAHRDGRLKPSVISPEEILHLRKAMRQLFKIINDATKIKQRLNQLFHQKEFLVPRKFPNLLKSNWGLQVMQRFIDDDVRSVVETLYPHKERFGQIDALIEGFKQLKSRLGEIERITLRTDMTQLIVLRNLADQLRLVYVTMARQNSSFRDLMRLLLTIPGVGPDTAAIMLAEIVDISYFSRPEKLVKWAGLAPRVYQSGHRKRITGKIHKGGNKYLRRALTLACQNIHAKGNALNSIWSYIKSKYKTPKHDSFWRAICAGARKLLTIIWYMLKRNQEWKWQGAEDTVLEELHLKVKRKIKGFQRMINRYEKTSEMLTRDMSDILDRSLYRGQDPKVLLRVLLSSV
jgi:transposase